ncbi:MAG: hypoxanthine-guanine phosphoribosyltransferase [Gammaproteobacteria bacterium]|nr:hypoxanthine-guanine phosphoribosyltransferase [Gammaproteobacteria bacterium]
MKLERAQQVHQQAVSLFDADRVEQTIAELAATVASDFENRFPLVLCVMNGGLYLTGQLLRYWEFPLTIDYVHTTRYRLATLGNDVLWKSYPQTEISDRHVLIVDDIFDQGYTLEEVTAYCHQHGAKSCKSIFLIRKTYDHRKADITPDYVGLECGDCYVYGAGMDLNSYFRNLSSIYYLDKKVTK